MEKRRLKWKWKGKSAVAYLFLDTCPSRLSFVNLSFVVQFGRRFLLGVWLLFCLFGLFVVCARVSRNEANTAESKRGNAQLRGTVIMDSAYF